MYVCGRVCVCVCERVRARVGVGGACASVCARVSYGDHMRVLVELDSDRRHSLEERCVRLLTTFR